MASTTILYRVLRFIKKLKFLILLSCEFVINIGINSTQQTLCFMKCMLYLMVVTFIRNNNKRNNLSKHEALKKLNKKKIAAATLKVITAPDFGLLFK